MALATHNTKPMIQNALRSLFARIVLTGSPGFTEPITSVQTPASLRVSNLLATRTPRTDSVNEGR